MFPNLAIVNGGPTLYSYFLCFWDCFRKSLLFEGGFKKIGAGKFPPYDFGTPKFNIMHQLCYIYIYLFVHIVLKYIEIHGSRMFKSFKSIKTHRHKSIITSIWIHKKNMIQSIEIQGVALPVFFLVSPKSSLRRRVMRGADYGGAACEASLRTWCEVAKWDEENLETSWLTSGN